jgi:hypothetical protein
VKASTGANLLDKKWWYLQTEVQGFSAVFPRLDPEPLRVSRWNKMVIMIYLKELYTYLV